MSHHKLFGYIGTYTRGESKGIYRFKLDTEKGIITDIEVASSLQNPTYLAISKDNKYLYSVVKEGKQGGVAAFLIHHETKSLELLNIQVQDGAPPCHVNVDDENQTVVIANYHKGTVESYVVNGELQTVTSIIRHKGSGPNEERQEKAHTHYAAFTPDQQYVVAVDLGTDQLVTYALHNGVLTKVNELRIKPGSGPRHLAFHPNGTYAYMMTELSSEIIVLIYHAENGSFQEIQSISTLPKDWSEESYGSAIHISADGRFVYAANRGHNSIALFQVNDMTGELQFIECTHTEGHWPRDFELDPTGTFLVAANEKSNNLALFLRDKETGQLKVLHSRIEVPEPVCVKFLHI